MKILKEYNLDRYKIPPNELQITDIIIEKCQNKYKGSDNLFYDLLLCCLIRYISLSSGANQFVIDLKYKKILRERFGVNFECFASVFNHYYDYYCSMFYDIEKYFGSSGSFMSLKINQGFYIANPPYDDTILNKMYIKVKRSLQSNKPVAFIMNIPKWEDYSLEKNIESDHLYYSKQSKHEYFHDPMKPSRKVLIPPYISYLFFNQAYLSENKYLINDIDYIFKTFKNVGGGQNDFPYRNLIYDDDYRIKIFKKLQNLKLKKYYSDKKTSYPNIKLSNVDYLLNGKYSYLLYDPKQYEIYMLSDLFNDQCRVQCQFGKHKSPYQYYKENKRQIIQSMKQQNIPITPINIREQIYLTHKECSVHNPLIIKHFIEKYNAKNVLDFSSGWGDRLIGAILSDVDYYFGVDPNKCLHQGYQKIINIFKPRGKYILVEAGFQDVALPNHTLFDLVYTSPPYFDYELYSKDLSQSVSLGKNEDEWLNNFLYPSIIKCINHLKNSGHLVLYFSQEKNKTYIEKWIHWMKQLKNVYYIGNIFYADIFLKNLHPIFIFQKNKNIPETLYNPPIEISTIKNNNLKLYIIRDDLIIGGTKNRAIIPYLKYLFNMYPDIKELIYLGASNGYAQIAFSYGLQLLKSTVKLTIYFQKTNLDESNKLSNLAKYLYPNVNYIEMDKTFKEIWPIVDFHLKTHDKAFLIPFGLDEEKYKLYLYLALKNYLDPYISKIKRLWVVIGSGVLFGTLYKILTNTEFCLVQVGKKVNLEKYDPNRIKLYQSSFKLYQKINEKILYPTTYSYDGKIWEFKNEFKDGDYIWNTAGIHDKI